MTDTSGELRTPSLSMDATLGMDTHYVQQITMLKQKLDDEHSNYKRKVQAYQESQTRQASLIQKLQNKVIYDLAS